MATEEVVGRSPSVVWRRTFGGVLVHTDDSLMALGGPAGIIWELLDEPRSRRVLLNEVALVHDVVPHAVRTDTDAAIDDLLRKGVLVRRPSNAPVTRAHRVAVRSEAILDNPIAAIASWGIGPGVALPDPTATGWPALRESIARERLSGIVFGAVRAGDLVLDEAQQADLAALHRAAMIVAVRTEHLLIELGMRFDAAGIPVVIHKGPSIAHRAYDDPAHRPFGDLDLLVPADDIDRTFDLLEACGHERRYSQPRPGFDRRFGKGAAFVTRDGLEIDVHRTFASGPFGLTVDLREVHAATGHLTIAGRDLRVLDPVHQIVAVLMHAALGTRWPRLLNLRDIVQLLRDVDLDRDAVMHTARRWQVDTAVARALRLTGEVFNLRNDPLITWARSHQPSGRQRRALDAYTSRSSSYGRQAISALPVIPGLGAKASYLRAMIVPDRSYEQQRDERLLARWRRLVRTARQR